MREQVSKPRPPVLEVVRDERGAGEDEQRAFLRDTDRERDASESAVVAAPAEQRGARRR